MATAAENRHKNLVSLASKHNILPYDLLMGALGINNQREFEDYIIQSIYDNVIQGRLNPMKLQLELSNWSSEGLNEPELKFMATTLKHWYKHSDQFLHTLAKEVERSKKCVAEIVANEKNIADEVENRRKSVALDEAKKFFGDKEGFKPTSKPETKRFKSGVRMKRGGD